MATLRELKGRIGSVASSQKITGAMKMISSAKMHKAEQSLRRLQPFRGQIEQVIGNILGADTPFTSPLMEEREVKKITILVFGSDDGLCGAYNVNIFKLLVTRVNELREKFGKNIAVEILPIGKKMQKAVSRIAAGNITLRAIDGIDSKTTGLGVKKFVDLLRDAFVAGDTDRVDYLYMNFRSVSRQRPVFGQFLPVTTQAFYAEGVRPSNRMPLRYSTQRCRCYCLLSCRTYLLKTEPPSRLPA